MGVECGRAEANLESLYRQAFTCWAAVPGWVERMVPEREARSSLFHHRMERKHRSAYEDIAREGYLRLAEGARAACLGNLAGLLAGLGRRQEAEALYREAIAARAPAFGARDAGLMHLCTDLADLLTDAGRTADAEKVRAKAAAVAANSPLTAQRRWAGEKPARMSDARKLLAAAYLTPIIHR